MKKRKTESRSPTIRKTPRLIEKKKEKDTEEEVESLGNFENVELDDKPKQGSDFVEESEKKKKSLEKKSKKDILGFPMGDVTVKSVKRGRMSDNNLAMSWRRRYPCPSKGVQRIHLSAVKEMIKGHPEGGSHFKFDILLLITTIMCEGISCGTINQRVLSSLKSEEDIKSMDWCGYVLDCLKRSKDKWKKDDEKSWYTGPLLFLVVWYAQEISKNKKKTPALLYWTSEELKHLESIEFSEDKYETDKDHIMLISQKMEKMKDVQDEAEDGEDRAEDQQQNENDQQHIENDQQQNENKKKSSRNHRYYTKEVFVGGLAEAYGLVREFKEDFYERMQMGFNDFPGDTLVMETIRNVKMQWYNDILEEKKTFEEDFEKEDVLWKEKEEEFDATANDVNDLSEETPEDIHGNKSNPDEVISLGSSKDSTSNEVEVDVQSGGNK